MQRFISPALCVWLLAAAFTTGAAKPALDPDVRRGFETLRQSHRLKISYGRFRASAYSRKYATWTFVRPGDYRQLARYARIFLPEFRKYPAAWIQATGLKQVVFVKDLRIQGQRRAAMPDAEGDVLYYDIEHGVSNAEYVRNVIHHEYFHLIEVNARGYRFSDPKWKSNNRPGFRYGPGGRFAYGKKLVRRLHPFPGFVSDYSRWSELEDRAEVYGALLTTSRYRGLQRWIRRDRHLRGKVQWMLDFMRSRLPTMSAAYLRRVHSR